jgi:hypothetical protein
MFAINVWVGTGADLAGNVSMFPCPSQDERLAEARVARDLIGQRAAAETALADLEAQKARLAVYERHLRQRYSLGCPATRVRIPNHSMPPLFFLISHWALDSDELRRLSDWEWAVSPNQALFI